MDNFDFSAPVEFTGGDAAERNWQLAKTHMIAEWSGDLDALMETVSRNDPFQIMYATGLHIVGFEEVREFYRNRLNTFSGQGFHADHWVVSASAIVGAGKFLGQPKGQFFGVEAIGHKLCLPMTLWIYIEDGLIKGETGYLDGVELRRQLLGDSPRNPVA